MADAGSGQPLEAPTVTRWYRIEPTDLPVGSVATVVAANRALCVTRTTEGFGVLDNRCPHQGGPLGEGQIEGGFVICPWHGYEYDPLTGEPPEGYGDRATVFPHEIARRRHVRRAPRTRRPADADGPDGRRDD